MNRFPLGGIVFKSFQNRNFIAAISFISGLIVAAIFYISIIFEPLEISNREVYTLNELRHFQRFYEDYSIENAEQGKAPPTSMKELLQAVYDELGDWPIVYEDNKGERNDWANFQILDSWGNPFGTLMKDGKIIAFFSNGPNGQWEDVQNDDVVLFIEGNYCFVRECRWKLDREGVLKRDPSRSYRD